MSATLLATYITDGESPVLIREKVNQIIDDLTFSLPDVDGLSSTERRGIIARYSSVLEGNFIYWMTATLLATRSAAAKPILIENLHEEVRDSHPHMLRKFYMAAHATPNACDTIAVDEELTNVRLFLGRLSAVQSLLTMAFFEGYIQRFMPFLANLAAAEGSTEMEYTDVHGVCDVAHTAGLFQALEAERSVNPLEPDKDIFEGVQLLQTLLERIVHFRPDGQPA